MFERSKVAYMRVGILGSGPNAFSAYKGLEDLGHDVTVIDYSYRTLTGSNLLSGLASKDHVFSYNSMFIPESFKSSSSLEGGLAGSASFGGWSNVWGATIFPFSEIEMSSWKLDYDELVHHQELISEKINVFKKSIDKFYPLSNSGLSRHIRSISKKLHGSDRIQISNLAISPETNSEQDGCIRCGKCIGGCPWDHIWSSRIGWGKIKPSAKLVFEDDFWIREVSEVDHQVVVKGQKLGNSVEMSFDKVFIALGSYQTAALMLRSKFCESVTIKDSPMFISPFVLPFFKKTSPTRPGITLASAFVSSTFTDPSDKNQDHDFFAQIYGYSEELELKILAQVPLLRLIPKIVRRFILSRIGIAMCFFNESYGGVIECHLTSEEEVMFTPVAPKDKQRQLSSLAHKNLYKFNFLSIPFFGRTSPIGLGYHSGSSFPHQEFPSSFGGNYSDYLGRPNGCSNIHIVDISVFPRIGSSPPTFNSMVNAHRIVHNVMAKNQAS